MKEDLLKKLANIAIVRQHINHIINSNADRKNINKIQKIGRDLDTEFAELLISTENEKDTATHSKDIKIIVSKEENINLVKDSIESGASYLESRPKIKTSRTPKATK